MAIFLGKEIVLGKVSTWPCEGQSCPQFPCMTQLPSKDGLPSNPGSAPQDHGPKLGEKGIRDKVPEASEDQAELTLTHLILSTLCVTEEGVRNHEPLGARAEFFIAEGEHWVQSSPYGRCLWVTLRRSRGLEPFLMLLTQRPERSGDQSSTDGITKSVC